MFSVIDFFGKEEPLIRGLEPGREHRVNYEFGANAIMSKRQAMTQPFPLVLVLAKKRTRNMANQPY